MNARPGEDDAASGGDTRSWSRREVLKGLATLGGCAGLAGWDLSAALADPPPETTRLRILATPAICVAPEFIAESLLRAEGFTDVQYVKFDVTIGGFGMLRSGTLDLLTLPPGNVLTGIEQGDPIVSLAGEHLGCYELFAHERIRSVRELKAKRVAIDGFGGPQHVFLSSIMAYVGLDPRQDIDWVVGTSAEALQFFIDGKADAFLAFPPEPQELRTRKIGHVLLSTTADKPWSQYYCCMVTAHRDFVQRYPIATKRALRAILMAADLCVSQPERAARMIVDKGFTANYDYALKTLREVSYNAWRTYTPEDTLRFHGVRLHEVGMIKTAPQKLIAQGTEWRFLNELKRELKA